jgi:hypothetical protein
LRCQADISLQAVNVETLVLWPADRETPTFIKNIFDEEPPEFLNKNYSEMVSLLNSNNGKRLKSGRFFQFEMDSTLPSAKDLVSDEFQLNIQKAHLRVLRTHSSGYQFWLHDEVDLIYYLKFVSYGLLTIIFFADNFVLCCASSRASARLLCF